MVTESLPLHAPKQRSAPLKDNAADKHLAPHYHSQPKQQCVAWLDSISSKMKPTFVAACHSPWSSASGTLKQLFIHFREEDWTRMWLLQEEKGEQWTNILHFCFPSFGSLFCFVLFFAFPEKMPKTRLEADFLSIHLGAFICFHVLIALCVCLFIKGVTRRGGHKVQVMTKCILA